MRSCPTLSCESVAVHAERGCTYHACRCFNSSGFLWVARPDSGAGTGPKRHAIFKFPFWAVILVPCQQRLTVFCILRPHPLLQVFAVFFSPGSSSHSSETVDGDLFVTAGILAGPPPLPSRCDSLCGQRVGVGSFSLSELKDAKIDGVAVPEPCALSADMDRAGIDPLCSKSLSRCSFENTDLYHVLELHGELDGAGDPLRGRQGWGWRTGSSSLSVRRCSSPTSSRK